MLSRFWTLRRDPREAIKAGALAIAAAAPWLMLYLAITGSPLPNTGSAKVFFFAEARRSLPDRIDLELAALCWCLIGPFYFGLAGLRETAVGRCALVFLVGWLLITLFTLPGGLSHNYYRYCSLAVPPLLLGWVRIFSTPSRLHTVIAPLLAVWIAANAPVSIRLYTDGGGDASHERMVHSVRNGIPAGSTILIHDAGFLPWTLPRYKFVDVVRLKSPDHIGWREALASTPETRARSISEIAAHSGAGYLVALEHDRLWGVIPDELRKSGWKFRVIDDGIPTTYAVYQLTPPKKQ
jgi:hypothetical protein